MPDFHLDQDQKTRLAKYFVGLSRDESQWLAERLAPIQTHIDSEHERVAGQPESSVSQSRMSPFAEADTIDADRVPVPAVAWYAQDSLKTITRELQDYAIENRFIRSRAVESANEDSVAYADTHDRILTGVDQLRRLYEVDYPAVDLPPPGVSSAQIADGETIFLALNCLSCHVFAPPGSTEAKAARLAPNLHPVHRRLRRQWVHVWMERPRRMAPHTYMPDFFRDDLTSPFALWAPDERQRLEELLHDKRIIHDASRAIKAMTNFLFDAGAKARTDIKFGSPVSR
jgi:hypothetical protein